MDADQKDEMQKPMACNLADQRKLQASTSILSQRVWNEEKDLESYM